jgi:DNA (cytosine-5)-methyltransferase 1
LVLENVKGLLSHDSGKTFQTILGVLSDLGYRVEWQVLNSKDFGVPQNRERVYIVGHFGNECGRKIFPITGTNGKNIKVAGYLDTPTWQKRNESIRRVYSIDGVAPTIPTGTGGGVMPKIKQQFVDLTIGNNAKTTEQARALQARYFKGYSKRPAETSGVKDGLQIRRLTPLECERLQGFPDDWTAGESDTQRYKMCGNAVTVNVVEAVMTGLLNEQ